MSMGKRILGSQRQRRVAVAYRALCIFLLIVIVGCLAKTVVDLADGVNRTALIMYVVSVAFVVFCARRGVLHAGELRRRIILLEQLLMLTVFAFVFLAVFETIDNDAMAFFVGSLGGGVVSGYEPFFTWALFYVGAGFLLVLTSYDERRTEMKTTVGGVLVIMGILMPKVLESYSLLQAHCYADDCLPEESSWIILFEIAVAYSASLSMMFVVGLFSETIIGFFRSSEEAISNAPQESTLADSQNSELPVSASEIAAASDTQNDGVELAPGSSSTATCVLQETADGVASPSQPKETLASACGSGVAVPTQLMSAAVGGLVAGACFSVVNRLFNRR